MGLAAEEAAYGVHTVANVSMIRAIRAVSTYRGRDPRDFALLAFGGSGPVHAAEMARALAVGRVIVPPAPGLLSAVGLLEALPEYHFVQTFFGRISDIDLATLNGAYGALETRAVDTLKAEGYRECDIASRRSADLRYVGQAYELTIESAPGEIGHDQVSALVERFHQEHERTYGHNAPEEPVEMVNLRMVVRGKTSQTKPERPILPPGGAESRRDAYYGPERGLLATPVVSRSDLSSAVRQGPLIVEEYDATAVVPPDCTVRLDQWNNIVIEIG